MCVSLSFVHVINLSLCSHTLARPYKKHTLLSEKHILLKSTDKRKTNTPKNYVHP